MPEHMLDRLFTASGGTFGRLRTARGNVFATLEREWLDNQPRVSCIPPGRYELVPWSGVKFKKHWALRGGTVGLWGGPGVQRSAILIHSANTAQELAGCIALGTLDAGRRTGLTGSRAAVRAFFDELEDERYRDGSGQWLTIQGGT
jgi:hypothetical protein